MKILLFSPIKIIESKLVSSSGGWISSLIKEVSKTKNELHVIYMEGNGGDRVSPYKNVTCWSVPTAGNSLNVLAKFRNILFQKDFSKTITSFHVLVDEIRPDIIQLFGFEHYYSYGLIRKDIPTVIHIQGVFNVIYRKYFSGLTLHEIKKNSSFIDRYFKFSNFILKKYNWRAQQEIKAIKKCNYFMGRTIFDKRITMLLNSKAEYFHLDEIIRESFFKSKWEYKPIQNVIHLTSILRDAPYKGLETIIDAILLLLSNQEYKISWSLIGINKNSSIFKICKRKYKDVINIEDYLIPMGNLIAKDLIGCLLKSNFYVNPSHIENSPNTLSEAMILGMPIITTYAGGISSIIENNKTAIAIQDGDPYSLAGAILQLVNDKNLVINLSKSARKIAINRHNKTLIIDDLLNIYKTIIFKK